MPIKHNSYIKVKPCKCGCGKPFTQGFKGYNMACVPEEERQQFTKKRVSQRNKANTATLARKLYKVQQNKDKPKVNLKKPNKPIRRLSKTMIANLKIYVPFKKEYLKNHPTCEAKLQNCTKLSVDIHHKAGRVGKMLYATAYFLAVCRNCHREIELNPARSKELGLSISRFIY